MFDKYLPILQKAVEKVTYAGLHVTSNANHNQVSITLNKKPAIVIKQVSVSEYQVNVLGIDKALNDLEFDNYVSLLNAADKFLAHIQ